VLSQVAAAVTVLIDLVSGDASERERVSKSRGPLSWEVQGGIPEVKNGRSS